MLDISSHDVVIVPSEFDGDNNQETAIYNIPSITEQVVTEDAVLAYTNPGLPGGFWSRRKRGPNVQIQSKLYASSRSVNTQRARFQSESPIEH